MSSTDESARLIQMVFEKEMLPLAVQLRAQGRELFPLGADPSRETYYQTRGQTTMTRADFELFGPGSIDDFAPAIAQLWRSQGWPELAPLAPSLARIARSVYFIEDQGDEVSPFMYVMF